MNWKQVFMNLLTRKMVMFFCSQASIFYLTNFGKLSGDNFIIVEGLIIGAFVAGNAYVHKYGQGNSVELGNGEPPKV